MPFQTHFFTETVKVFKFLPSEPQKPPYVTEL